MTPRIVNALSCPVALSALNGLKFALQQKITSVGS